MSLKSLLIFINIELRCLRHYRHREALFIMHNIEYWRYFLRFNKSSCTAKSHKTWFTVREQTFLVGWGCWGWAKFGNKTNNNLLKNGDRILKSLIYFNLFQLNLKLCLPASCHKITIFLVMVGGWVGGQGGGGLLMLTMYLNLGLAELGNYRG